MDEPLPPSPWNYSASLPAKTPPSPNPPIRDWPHAPVHRLSEHGVYIVTAGTLNRRLLFDNPDKLDGLEHLLLALAKQRKWHLEAWAVLGNHYHFVARGAADSVPLGEVIQELHSVSARELNRMDDREGRTVWYNYWDTRLTFQHSYLARLKYVHQNAAKHGLVSTGNQYPWCSAAWFERVASPAQVKTIYSMRIDKIHVYDDF